MTEIWEKREADLSPSLCLLSASRCGILVSLATLDVATGILNSTPDLRAFQCGGPAHFTLPTPHRADGDTEAQGGRDTCCQFRGRNQPWFLSNSMPLLFPPRIHGFRPTVPPETLSRLSLGKARPPGLQGPISDSPHKLPEHPPLIGENRQGKVVGVRWAPGLLLSWQGRWEGPGHALVQLRQLGPACQVLWS